MKKNNTKKYSGVCLIIFLLLSICFSTQIQSATTSHADKKIFLDFQDIPVRSALQVIAKLISSNVIISDAVSGNITLHLKNIAATQALNVILQSRGLSQRQMGNVLFIAPSEEITLHDQQQLKSLQQIAETEPLKTAFMRIHYGKATDIAATLREKDNRLLSTRGVVSVDPRTNSLWIQDIPAKLAGIRTWVQQLDIPMQQVLIEARIVNIDAQYEEDIGVKFGLSHLNHISGTLEGANSLAGGAALSNIPLKDRLNFDLGVTPAAGRPASLGLALLKLDSDILLDLELSALESIGAGEIISTPHLMTANQQAAEIQAGEEIPYQEATSSGATNVSFKKAVLSLNVMPQITTHDKILLKLKVNQDKASVKLVNNVPAIDTREIETQVLVDNGQTIVLGGILEQDKDNQVERVPFLGELPVIGKLFSRKHFVNNRRELLIFVTPKIVEF